MTREMVYALLVALLIAGLFAAFAIPSYRRSSELTRVASEWFRNVSAEQYETAYARMAPAYRDAVSYDSFRDSVSRNLYLKDFRSFHNRKAHFQDDRARLLGQLGSQAGEFESEIHFVRIAGGERSGARAGGGMVGSAERDRGRGGDRDRDTASFPWYIAGVTVAGAPVISMTVDR